MQRFNLADPPLELGAADPPGYRAGMFRLTAIAGATRTGTSLYDVPPGEAICPYHYETGEEEWLLVLDGRPTLRAPDGAHELAPLDCVFFPAGPEGAHAVRNDTTERVRVLMWSEVRFPGATVYPDSGKVGVWTGDANAEHGTYRIASRVDYYDGES